jgi:hypothetical protein
MLWEPYYYVMHWLNSRNPQEWFLLLIAVLVLGAFFLRGFGSRSKY